MARVAVFGGFGFLGSHVCEALTAAGYEAFPLSRRNGFHLEKLSLAKAMLSDLKPDYIINCAAVTGGVYAQASPGWADAAEQNLLVHLNAMRVATAVGFKKYINLITSSTYPALDHPLHEYEVESGPLDPSVEGYGIAKRMSLVMARLYARQGHQIQTLCPTGIYGPRDNFGPSGKLMAALIKRFYDAMKAAGSVVVDVKGTHEWRDWSYVTDVAERIVCEMATDRIGLLNLAPGHAKSTYSLSNLVADVAGYKGEIRYEVSLIGVKYKVLAGNTPMPTSLEDGIRKTLDWLEQQ